MKRIVMCADDFGLDEPGCEAIIALAASEAISAVTCVVDGSSIRRHAPALRAACMATSGAVSLGLHLNFTESGTNPLRASLPRWLARAYVRRCSDAHALRTEIDRQLILFEDVLNTVPAFVDGHEHVHQFPGVAEALLDRVTHRYGSSSIAVRSTVPRTYRGLKAHIIASLGGRRMQRLLSQRSIPTNTDFAGVYAFSTEVSYGRRMRGWIASIANDGLIMCHPQRPPASDSAPTARRAEYAFLTSPLWRGLLTEYNTRLVPFIGRTHEPGRMAASS